MLPFHDTDRKTHVIMNDTIDYDYLKRLYAESQEKDKVRLREAKRKRNVAAMVDFASNLLTLAGYSKGARVSLATDNLPKYEKLYELTKERYNNSMRDYNGEIAKDGLFRRARTGNGGNNSGNGSRRIPFIAGYNAAGKPKLTSGMFERAVNDYYKFNKR